MWTETIAAQGKKKTNPLGKGCEGSMELLVLASILEEEKEVCQVNEHGVV